MRARRKRLRMEGNERMALSDKAKAMAGAPMDVIITSAESTKRFLLETLERCSTLEDENARLTKGIEVALSPEESESPFDVLHAVLQGEDYREEK